MNKIVLKLCLRKCRDYLDLEFKFIQKNCLPSYKQIDTIEIINAGADPGILVRGGRGFFFKGMGFGARLRPPVGPQGAKPPEVPEF